MFLVSKVCGGKRVIRKVGRILSFQSEHEGGKGMGSKTYELFQEVLDKIQHIVDKLNETGEEDKRNSEDHYKMNIKKLKSSQEYLYSGIILTCHIFSRLGPLVARDTTFLSYMAASNTTTLHTIRNY